VNKQETITRTNNFWGQRGDQRHAFGNTIFPGSRKGEKRPESSRKQIRPPAEIAILGKRKKAGGVGLPAQRRQKIKAQHRVKGEIGEGKEIQGQDRRARNLTRCNREGRNKKSRGSKLGSYLPEDRVLKDLTVGGGNLATPILWGGVKNEPFDFKGAFPKKIRGESRTDKENNQTSTS